MSKKEKLMARLLSKPKDFTFEELIALLGYFDYEQINLGKTSGSRVAFTNGDGDYIRLHKPHTPETSSSRIKWRMLLPPYKKGDCYEQLHSLSGLHW